MTSPVKAPQASVDVTAAKAWMAGIGSTLTALQVALAVALVAANDGQIDGGEAGTLVTAAITLISTVWGVWRVPNTPVEQPNSFVTSR